VASRSNRAGSSSHQQPRPASCDRPADRYPQATGSPTRRSVPQEPNQIPKGRPGPDTCSAHTLSCNVTRQPPSLLSRPSALTRRSAGIENHHKLLGLGVEPKKLHGAQTGQHRVARRHLRGQPCTRPHAWLSPPPSHPIRALRRARTSIRDVQPAHQCDMARTHTVSLATQGLPNCSNDYPLARLQAASLLRDTPRATKQAATASRDAELHAP